MTLDSSFIGRSFPATAPYDVGRESIRAFARAVGATSPAHHDVDAARAIGHADLVAPPTYPIVMSLRASEEVVADPALGLDWSRVVHGGQRFVAVRPLLAGDQVQVVVHIDDIKTAGGNDILTLRGEIATVAGEHVCTSFTTLVARGPDA